MDKLFAEFTTVNELKKSLEEFDDDQKIYAITLYNDPDKVDQTMYI